MLVEDYRKQFTAKGFATEDIQFFSRFYPKKGVGHASIVIPSVDYSGLLHVTFFVLLLSRLVLDINLAQYWDDILKSSRYNPTRQHNRLSRGRQYRSQPPCNRALMCDFYSLVISDILFFSSFLNITCLSLPSLLPPSQGLLCRLNRRQSARSPGPAFPVLQVPAQRCSKAKWIPPREDFQVSV